MNNPKDAARADSMFVVIAAMRAGEQNIKMAQGLGSAKDQYAVFAMEDDDTFVSGRTVSFLDPTYHNSLAEATAYMIWRATKDMDFGKGSLSKEMLSEKDLVDLRSDFELSARKAHIEKVLDDLTDELHLTEDHKSLILQNEEFISAMTDTWECGRYNYAEEVFYRELERSIKDAFRYEFPELLPHQLESTVKVAPEQMALINDLLGKTADELAAKYGAIGDTPSFNFIFNQDTSGSVQVCIPNEGKSYLQVQLHTAGDEYIPPRDLLQVDHNPGKFTIQDSSGMTFTMYLIEEPYLRRVGNQFEFSCNSNQEIFKRHDRELCTILRSLEPKVECQPLAGGQMYMAKFPDGTEFAVFDDELLACEYTKEVRPLNERLQAAGTQASPHIQQGRGAAPNKEH